MKLYSFLLWLCCFILPTTHTLIAQTTVDFNGLNAGEGYGKLFGLIEPGDIDELSDAGGFVFAITASHSLTSVVSVAAEGYNNSTCISTNSYGNGVVSQWIIKKNDNTKFQFKGVFLKDAGFGGSTEGTVTAYRGGQKVGAAVNVSFDGSLNQSFTVNPDFYDVDELRIEALDLDIYLDQFMAGPPYGPDVNAPAQVMSIVIEGNPNSSATTVNFLVMFDKPVMNVSVEDFIITSTGISPIAAIASVTGLSPSLYKVSVTGVTGEGTIKLGVHADTDIVTVVGSIPGTPAFTAGEIHSVGACGIENFDQGETDNASSFSNNGIIYQLTGNWKVRKYSPPRGLHGSAFHLSGTGTSAMSIKGSGNNFKVRSFYLFLSDDISGDQHATNGTVTVTGKLAGNQKFTQLISTDFNSNPASNSGYTYIDLEENGSIAVDELEIQLGGSFQYVDMDNISLCPISNEAPLIANLNGDVVSYIEGASERLIDFDSNATVTDVDSPDFDGGNLTASIAANRVSSEDILSIRNEGTGNGQIGVSGSHVTYEGITIGTWAGGTGTSNLVINFNANSSSASAQALIRNLTYSNNNTTDPSTLARTVTVTINDGDGGTSAAATVTVNILAVNDAPTLTATGITPTFIEGGAAVPMFSNAQSSTIEAGQLISKLTLTVSGVQDGANELIVVDGTTIELVNGNSAFTASNEINVTISLNGTTATVTLSRTPGVSTADLNTIVNGIVYLNTSTNPNTANRVVTLTSIQDNGGTANGGANTTSLTIVSTISVVAVNDAPVVTTSSGTTSFTEGDLDVIIDEALTLSDPDNSTLASATVYITGNLQSSEDVLSFTNDGSLMGNVTASYNAVAGVLTMTSSGASASLAQWQAALRAVSYKNTSQSPNTADRTISFKVNDGSLESAAASKLVSVTAVNDPPVIWVPEAQSVYRDTTLLFNAANNNLISISDVDGDAGMAAMRVTLTATNGTITLGHLNGLTIGYPATGSNDITITLWGTLTMLNDALDGLVFTPIAGFTGVANIHIETNDGGNTGTGGPKTVTDDILITVKPPNPSITSVGSPTPNGTYKVGDEISITITFDQNVTVNSAGEEPSILLETGTLDRFATYLNGSGSNTLKFTYEVQSGDLSDNLDYHSTSALALNGASIKNADGNDAILTFPAPGTAGSLGANSAIVVDGVRPTVISVVLSQTVLKIGETAAVTIVFSEKVTGLSVANIITSNGTLSSLSTADNRVYTATLEPDAGINSEGNTITIDLAHVKDVAGNSGEGTASSLAYEVRTKKPAAPITPKLNPNDDTGISNSDNITSKTQLNFLVNNPDGVDLMKVWDAYKFFVDGVAHNTTSISSSTNMDYWVTLSPLTEGTHVIKNKFTDKYGNESDFSEEVLVTIDLTAPTGTILINNGNLYTNKREVTLGMTSDELGVRMSFSTDGTTWSSWEAFSASEILTLPAGDGTKKVYLRLQDIAGNISSIYSDEIILDTQAPIVTGVTGGGIYNDDRTIVFNEGDATLNGANIVSGTTVSAEGNYTLIVTDAAGNSTTVQFEIDKTAPLTPQGLVLVQQGTGIKLNWADLPDPDRYQYILYVQENNGTKAELARLAKDETSYLHENLQGGIVYHYSLEAIDKAGNSSGQAEESLLFKVEQKIIFSALAEATYGDADITLTATASSGLEVEYIASNANVADVYRDQNDGNKWKIRIVGAGNATITARQIGNNVYKPAVQINQLFVVNKASLPAFTFADSSFVYDGTKKSIEAKGLPAATTVSYTNNNQINAGEYRVTATIDGGDNYFDGSEIATLTIKKAALPAFTFVDASFVYDGTAKSLVVTGLPVEATASYTNNNQINAGEYMVAATIDGGINYEGTTTTAKLTIAKAVLPVFTFADASFVYDGTAKSIEAKGLPAATTVSYTNNNQTNAGVYTVAATIDGGINYEGTTKTAKLTIAKAVLPAFTFVDATFTYDGTAKSLAVTGLPAGTPVSYENNEQTEAGEYTVTAKIEEGKNYIGSATKTAKLKINPLQQVINFIEIIPVTREAGIIRLDITSNSNLPIRLYSDNLLVAEIQGDRELLIKGVGRSMIRAEQGGDANHIAATAVEQLLEVLNEQGAKLPVRVHPAVSPNGDGINEFLRIEGIEQYPENKLNVFDGNGNKIQSFEYYDNHSNYFDGTMAGRPVPNGTYFYMLEVKVNGKWLYDKGYFVVRK